MKYSILTIVPGTGIQLVGEFATLQACQLAEKEMATEMDFQPIGGVPLPAPLPVVLPPPINSATDRKFQKPLQGAVLKGALPYGALAITGTNIAQVWFLLDGVSVSGPEGGAPWEGGPVDTTKYVDGVHLLQADIKGTNGQMERIQISVVFQNSTPLPTPDPVVPDEALFYVATGCVPIGE